LNLCRDLLIKSQQPQAVDDLVLHLILAVCRAHAGVQVFCQALNAVELVEHQSVVVDAEQHLQTATQSILVWVL
jgi:hypothetical protein